MLTVFIATRNRAETLSRTLHAHTQLLPPPGGWKLVIIDNRSDDDTARTARAFAGRLPLVVLSEPRAGKNRALNTGLSQLEGDLAVFSDDDALPDRDWLIALRSATDEQRDYGAFGGLVAPLWDAVPEDWIIEWVRIAPVFGLSDPTRKEGACDPTEIWGPNMAVRAEWFRRGYRFDETLGPNGSGTYSMGGETELTLRLALEEGIRCWYCTSARVSHIIAARQLTRAWILKRAFRLGRCVRRESQQRANAGQPHVRRDLPEIFAHLSRDVSNLARSKLSGDQRSAFEARWRLNLWCGCLYEALSGPYEPHRPLHDARV